METTVDDVHAALAAGQLACRELVEGHLAGTEAYERTMGEMPTN